MRIAMFTNNYLPRVSGPAHSINILQKQLRDFKHIVKIFAPQYSNYRKNSDNIIRVTSITFPHRIFYPIPLLYFSNAEQEFRQNSFDIIHSHHPIMLGQLALDFAKKYKIPLVYSYHSQWHSYLYRFFQFFPFDQVTKIFASMCNEYALKADAVIVPNKIFRDIFLKAGQKKVFVIPSPINDKLFNKKIQNAKEKLRRKLNIPLNSKIILSVSRLSFEKNVDFLIESFALINKEKNVFLIIIGDGLARLKIKNLIHSLNLNKRIFLYGQIPHKSLPLFYQGCSVFAQVSDFETQCLALNEAMASGCVIVAKKSDYLIDVIENNRNGYIAGDNIKDYASALAAAINNSKKNSVISLLAEKDSNQYSSEFIAKKVEKLYKKIISSRRV